MSLMHAAGCCCNQCNATCLAVAPETNSCDHTTSPAYINSLPGFVTVEIDLTWDGTPYTFSFVMKKFSEICNSATPPITQTPVCRYLMYCGDVDECNAWPNTITGEVYLGRDGIGVAGCGDVICPPNCQDQRNPGNASTPYKAIITCIVTNGNYPPDPETDPCPCVYPDVGCAWIGAFNIKMVAGICESNSFFGNGTASIATDTRLFTTHVAYLADDFGSAGCDDWSYPAVSTDYCIPVFLLKGNGINYGLPNQCGATSWTNLNYAGYWMSFNFGSTTPQYSCWSPLIASYPLNNPAYFYNNIFDGYGSSIGIGGLSTNTYTPCCGTATSTGGHAIPWVVTRFEVS